MQKKIILIIISTFILGCASIQRYEEVVQRGYRKTSDYEGYRARVEDSSTFLRQIGNREDIFYFIEKKDEEVKLYISIRYIGRDWLYMSKIEFVDAKNGDSYLLDFYEHKLYRPIWKDRTTITMKVEEYMAFPLKEEEINSINKYLKLEDVHITLHSDYDERIDTRELSSREKELMLDVYSFYMELKDDIARELEEAKAQEKVEEDPNMEFFYRETNEIIEETNNF